jgi:hypothetical protein
MEEGCQESKRLSYTAKFKHEAIQCAEKGNRKATSIFGVNESNIRLWQKHKTAISGCEMSQRKFTGPKKGQFPEIDDAVFTFFQERGKIGLFVSYDLLPEEVIKKATSLNTPPSCFEVSKGWAIRFMHRMGLALHDIVWEDNVEDKGDSNWVESTDNDSVMSDDSESDE